jgi:hypothetical protein
LFKTSIFWLFIALGQNFKSEKIKDSKVLIIDLLKEGIDVYKYNREKLKELEFDEQVECWKYIIIIDDLLLGKFNTKCFICKDSTASVLQHLHIYNGYKDIEALQKTNIIGSDYWYDPYSIIIDTFIKEYDKNNSKDYLKYFTRKTLKKSIMTHPYSVSHYRSYCYFLNGLDKVLKKEGKNFWSLSKEEKKDFSETFSAFYKFLDKDFETKIFYNKESKDFINEVGGIYFLDDTILNLTYNEKREERKELKCKLFKMRTSYDKHVKSNYVNEKGTKTSIRANIIHSSDAFLNRLFVQTYNSLSIHDCFCLHLANVNSCIHFINLFFHSQINNTNKNLIKKSTEKVYIYDKKKSVFIIKFLNYDINNNIYNKSIIWDENKYSIDKVSLTIIL